MRAAVVLRYLAFAVLLCGAELTSRPTVLWHGMGDTCCFPFSMGAIKGLIQTVLPGTYVYSVEIGGNIISDELQGFISNVNNQVDFVCQTVKADPNLQGGFNAVGFSQGGQFLRAYVERCNDPPVFNLVSIGGQHQGVADIPDCTSVNSTMCSLVEELLAFGAYSSIAQDNVVQAQYFKDPLDIPTYLKANRFLPDINNERTAKNGTYKKHLTSLNALVLAQFEYDTVVVPRESEWFGRYENGNVNKLLTMEETIEYQQDWIGLKTLNDAGKIHFLSIPGNHMQLTMDWFTKNICRPFLA